MAESVVTGNDPQDDRDAIRSYADAGVDHVSLHRTGPDRAGVADVAVREVLPPF